MRLTSILVILTLSAVVMGEVVPVAKVGKVISCEYSSEGRIDVYGTTAIFELGSV